MNAVRPRQVTIAAWLIMLGSVAVLATVFDQIRQLHSLGTRSQVQKVLDSGVGKSLNWSVDDMLTMLHVLAMVAAGCATACVILGWHLLKRSTGARIALTVVAVPLWLTGLSSDGLFSTLVAVAVATLWFQPARGWFEATRAITDSGPPPVGIETPTPPPSLSTPSSAAGRPTPQPLYSRRVVGERPRMLVWAAVLTWVFSGIASVVVLLATAVVVADPQEVLDRLLSMDPTLKADGLNQDTVRAIIIVIAVVVISWCVAASALALLVWRRVRWAHPVLIVCVSVSALLQLFAVFGNPFMVISLVASVVTIRLLLRPEVRAWLLAPRAY